LFSAAGPVGDTAGRQASSPIGLFSHIMQTLFSANARIVLQMLKLRQKNANIYKALYRK
jgi:hypothetical protein